MTNVQPASSPIEDYLDELLVSLAMETPRRQRHLVAEADSHLRDAVADLMAAGIAPQEAESRAVARFGPVAVVASAHRGNGNPKVTQIIAQFGLDALLLSAFGAIAVGVSGLVAGVFRLIGGVGAVADLSSGPQLTPQQCREWVSAGSSGQACHQAASVDWAAETVFYRLAIGLFGLGVLALAILARRYARRRGAGRLPRFVADTVAATVFGLAGFYTLGLGVDASVLRVASGQWFSAAIVALPVGVWFAARLVRDLRGLRLS